MAKPESFPPPVEPDDEEEEEEEKSTLPADVADREAKRAIEEIEREVEEEHPPKRAPPAPHVSHEGDRATFLDKAWERQYKIEGRLKQIGHGRYSRVIKMARKPEHDEFVKASQITGIGIIVIGFVGFLIYLFTNWLWNLLGIK